MKGLARGRIDGDRIAIDDATQGQRLHQKGHVGESRSGGAWSLSRVEAAYAMRAGRLHVEGTWHGLLNEHHAETQYWAYADLRDRGLVVRHAGNGLDVWRRGEAPPQDRWFHAVTVSERDPVDLDSLPDDAIVAVVDDDGAVTHYQSAPVDPQGTVQWPQRGPHDAVVLNDRVFVPGGAKSGQGMGTVHGDDLVLSITEATALHERGWLTLDPDALTASAGQQQDFRRTLPIYRDLRDRGVLPKSGFRFGTHFRAYSGSVDAGHAEWLVQCYDPEDRPHWSNVSRAVRLAHGVRKTMVLATTERRYLGLSWFRP